MAVRKKRRSNWYIYVITFLITAGILALVVLQLWSYIFPQKTTYSSTGLSDYRPSKSQSMTVLFMIGEMKGGTPSDYMIFNYRPRDDIVVCVPLKETLKISASGTEGSLTEIYNSMGATGVVSGVNSLLGIECKNYVKFDRTSFTDFVDSVGYVTIDVAQDVEWDGEVLKAGSNSLNGSDMYNYMFNTEFEDGDDYTAVVQAVSVCALINQNSHGMKTTKIQELFNKILNTTDTNFTFVDYTNHQQSFAYTSENSYVPAEYYVPYGETSEDGYFTVAEGSKVTIQSRFGLDELDLG